VSGAHLHALRQGPHIKVATVASRWQRVGDLIGSGFEPHTPSEHGKYYARQG